jgi:hypothetical protein
MKLRKKSRDALVIHEHTDDSSRDHESSDVVAPSCTF